jgi:type IV pilus assembly protein PilO
MGLKEKLVQKKNNLRYHIQSVKEFDFQSMDFQEAGSWPVLIKTLFMGAVCGTLLYFGNSLYLSKQVVKYTADVKKEDTLLEAVSGLAYVKPTLEDYSLQLEQLEKNLQEISTKLPEKIEMSSILKEMTQLANSNNVKLDSINLEREEEQENYIELPFNISAKGKFHNFAAFLSELSRINRIVTVHDIAIQPSQENPNLLEMQLVAKTYKYKKVEVISAEGEIE